MTLSALALSLLASSSPEDWAIGADFSLDQAAPGFQLSYFQRPLPDLELAGLKRVSIGGFLDGTGDPSSRVTISPAIRYGRAYGDGFWAAFAVGVSNGWIGPAPGKFLWFTPNLVINAGYRRFQIFLRSFVSIDPQVRRDAFSLGVGYRIK